MHEFLDFFCLPAYTQPPFSSASMPPCIATWVGQSRVRKHTFEGKITCLIASEVLPPIGNKCRQFCTSLVQSLY
jgi:hypothetical protein